MVVLPTLGHHRWEKCQQGWDDITLVSTILCQGRAERLILNRDVTLVYKFEEDIHISSNSKYMYFMVPCLDNPGILGYEVCGQQKTKLLRTVDSMLLGQHVDRVLLTVRGDDVTVVTVLVVLAAGERQQGLHLQLLYGVHSASLGEVQQLYTSLGRVWCRLIFLEILPLI